MQLSSAFLNKRELSELQREELEDLDYHLQNRRTSLLQKINQLERDLADIEADREKVREVLHKHRAVSR